MCQHYICGREYPCVAQGTDTVYIEFKTGHPDMRGKGECGAIGLQGDVTDGVASVL